MALQEKRIKEAGITSIGSQSADEVLSLAEHMEMDINRQPSDQVYEFENLEELRIFDESYQNHSNNQAMELISSVFQIPESEIHNIHCLKSGMTNKIHSCSRFMANLISAGFQVPVQDC